MAKWNGGQRYQRDRGAGVWEPGDDLEIFVDDAVRSFQLVYTETVDDGGIEAYWYRNKTQINI